MENSDVKHFNLWDFKFGDIIILRNGTRFVYADGYIYGENEDYNRDADKLNEEYYDDLCYRYGSKEYDIIKVERVGETVFKRESEIKEMTLEEVCKELGYEIKIIKED